MSPAADPGEKKRYGEIRERNRKIALGGFLTALAWLFVILASILPTATLSLRALASFTLLVAQLRLGGRAAWLCYLSSSLLALSFPGLWQALPFLLFFGPYVPLAFSIAGRWPGRRALGARLFIGSALIFLSFIFYGKSGFSPRLTELLGGSFYYVLLAASVLFCAIFDYLMNILALLYKERLEPHLRR